MSAVAPDKPRAAVDPARRPGEGRDPVSFPRYPKYKNSGVEWLGEVPAHWEVTNCRSLVEEQTAKNEGAKDQNYLSLMANVGVLPYEEKGDVGNKKPEDLTKCKLVSKGDFVINSMNYGIGSYGVSPYDGVCSPVYIVLRPRLDRIEPRFAFRLFENRAFQTHAQSFGNGILEHRAAISWDILKGIGVPVPPRAEQAAILRFLDRETAKIDALIAEQERLVALLKEKRQALISHAVTKGLDPNAPMKESGIEWLGEVPAHWGVIRLRYFADVLRGKFTHRPRNDPAFYDGEFPFIQTGDITGASRYIESYKQTLNERGAAVSKEFPAGTLVMAIAANIGDAAILTFPAYFPDSIVGMVPKAGIELQYLYYLVIAMKAPMLQTATISTQMNLNVDQIVSLVAARPPIVEQTAVVRFLDIESTKIDLLMGDAKHAIGLLKERRSGLISAAVAGKICVLDS